MKKLLTLAAAVAMLAGTASAADARTYVKRVHGPLKLLPHHKVKVCEVKYVAHHRVKKCNYH